jgi:hypothetical protein
LLEAGAIEHAHTFDGRIDEVAGYSVLAEIAAAAVWIYDIGWREIVEGTIQPEEQVDRSIRTGKDSVDDLGPCEIRRPSEIQRRRIASIWDARLTTIRPAVFD